MSKTTPTPSETTKQEDLLGKNTILTLTVPKEVMEKEYAQVLRQEAGKVTLKGFRKGKAPLPLAEGYLGKEKLTEHTLNHLLPHLYEEEVAKTGIIPLVRPEYSAKEMGEGKAWVFEAATAIAPEITLGDYHKLIGEGSKKYDKKLRENKESKENVDERLQRIFVTLIEAIKPKIAPLLLQEEMNQQLQALVSQLATRKLELSEYILAQGKTEEEFRQDLAALSLGALQLEFVLQEITKDLKLKITETDIKEWMKIQKYPEDTKIPEELRMRLEASLLRRKTTDAILKLALPS